MRKPLILASASPRRSELLQQVGIPFVVRPSSYSETAFNTSPQSLARQNALGKARQVAAEVGEGLVVGADTIVVTEDRILGKPKDKQEAREMLNMLSDSWHKVMTGIAVVDAATGRERDEVVTTRVLFRCLAEDELEQYLDSDEPYDKAGAYGIQGKAALFVARLDGCYFNVVGLPLSRLSELVDSLR